MKLKQFVCGSLQVVVENSPLFWVVFAIAASIRYWDEPTTSGWAYLGFGAYWLECWFAQRKERRRISEVGWYQDRLLASLKRELALLEKLDPPR